MLSSLRSSSRLWRLVLVAAFLLLSACRQDLYSGLPEREANLILATLLENGLEAEKVSRGKNGFTILVEKSDLVRALNILEKRSFPRERFKNLGDVFSGQGMIASPTEEQARLAFAIEQELAGTFARIDGVLTARAHVVLERHDAATGISTPASTAIFLRHRSDFPLADLQGKIKETCVRAVPGLVYDKVSVMLVPVRSEVLLPDPRQATQTAQTLLPVGFFWMLVAALLIFLAGALLRFKHYRKNRAARKESV
jgi:type III secretion protein J